MSSPSKILSRNFRFLKESKNQIKKSKSNQIIKKKVIYRQVYTSTNEEFLLEIFKISILRANIRDIKRPVTWF